tara:strand:- start:338 stop:685 length:348 start_codon:yes stop_codon:yes gene_type:complete
MFGLSDNTLKAIWALEIKWSDRYFEKPKELKSLIKFCQENSIKTPIVTAISKEGEVEYADVLFQFLPSSAYEYIVGKNTLGMKIKNKHSKTLSFFKVQIQDLILNRMILFRLNLN